jgi:hypothetical protein
MVETVGWRSFWWFNTGLLGLSFLMVVFMFPETRYPREWVPEAAPGSAAKISPAASSTEKNDTAHHDDVGVEQEKIQHVPTASSVLPSTEEGLSREETAARDPYLGKGKPSKKQWGIFQKNAHPFKSIFLDLWIPWKLFAFPIVEFASFVVSWSCSSFLTLNLTQSQVFSVAPYNFKPLSIGKSPIPFLLHIPR